MRKVVFGLSLCAVLLALCVPAEAQQPEKVYCIDYLAPNSVHKGFRQRLRELGYIEGQNLVIEARLSKSKSRLYPKFAADLVRLRVDLILTVVTGATRAAQKATRTIPIVMVNYSGDPVRDGVIANLAHPGGNITGVFDIMSDLAGKRLELPKGTFPKISRVAHLSAAGTAYTHHLEETEAVARKLGVGIQPLEVRGPDHLEEAFRVAVEGDAEALIVVGVNFFIRRRQRIIDLELNSRLPAMHTHGRWVPAGGLMSYTTDNRTRYRQAAIYVDRILKGAKPADLPVERPTKFRFEINLKTAKQIGLTIPPEVLMRADRVIK